MRWLKHLTNAHDDECMAELIDEFGPEGYGIWWIILEKIAAQMDKTDRCSARYSVRKWAKTCGISAKKFQKVVGFLAEIGKLSAKNCKKNSDFLIIECRNLLKFRDEYSKKSGQTPDKRRTKSGASPDQDTEAETEAETDTETDTEAAPLNPPPEPFESDCEIGRENTEVQDAFLDCEKKLGMSQEEIIEAYENCVNQDHFPEAVRFTIEENEKELKERPVGFIIWACKNGKTSKKTRAGRRGGGAAYDPEYAQMLEEETR